VVGIYGRDHMMSRVSTFSRFSTLIKDMHIHRLLTV